MPILRAHSCAEDVLQWRFCLHNICIPSCLFLRNVEQSKVTTGHELLSPPRSTQVEAAAGLLRPLLARVETQLPAAAAAAGAPAGRAAAAAVLQALEAIARVSKGFSLALTTKRPALGDLLAAPLAAAIRIPSALPGNRVLRGRVISFLHRMVECLGERLLGTLPAALAALLPAAADAGEVGDVAALLQQLATRFRAALLPLLVKARPA